MKVIILHNRVRKERIQLFDKLSKYVNLEIIYFEKKATTLKHNHKFISSKKNIVYLPMNFKELISILKTADIVIICLDYKMIFINLIALLFKNKFKYKLISWTEDINASYFKFKTLFSYFRLKYFLFLIYRATIIDFFYKLFFKKSDAILSGCQLTTKWLCKYGLHQKIFTGIQDIDYSIETPHPIKKDKINVVYLGRLVVWKGVQDIILAMKAIHDNNIVLHIIGTGKYAPKLKKLSKNMENIVFYGWLNEHKKNNLLRRADILILPSYNDPWGFVVAEGMAKGLAIITTEDVGAKELIDGNGYIYNAGHIDELIKILKDIQKNPNKINIMKKKSNQIIKRHSLNNSIKTLRKAIKFVENDIN